MGTLGTSSISEHAMKLKTLVCLSLIALVASLSPAAHAQTFSTIHSFTGGSDGANPSAGVTIRAGHLYGTTTNGGSSTYGSIYDLSQSGANWVIHTIAVLTNNGYGPESRLVFGPDGHAYSTAATQSAPPWGGSVFDLVPPLTLCKTANCLWSVYLLYTFRGPPSDGLGPGFGDLVWDQQGNMYGTTVAGGIANDGTVYRMTKSANNWTEAPVYNFSAADGASPWGGVVVDSNGNLFGTTSTGGLYGWGTVFELTYMSGKWVETFHHDLQSASDGATPKTGLTIDSSGNLYGATTTGGSGGGGTVFELTRSGNTWVFNVLYSFSSSYTGPEAVLTLDAGDNLYGTTPYGGANGRGTVFKLTNTPNGWQFTSLHDFTGGDDGWMPISNVSIDTDGNLYGTAYTGGSNNCLGGCGVVWMIKP